MVLLEPTMLAVIVSPSFTELPEMRSMELERKVVGTRSPFT